LYHSIVNYATTCVNYAKIYRTTYLILKTTHILVFSANLLLILIPPNPPVFAYKSLPVS